MTDSSDVLTIPQGTSCAGALDEARARLAAMGVPDRLPELSRAGISVSRSVLGGSHSVAVYPPLDSLQPVAQPEEVVNALSWSDQVSLYVHIAFCETRCTFCHYAVDHYPGKADGAEPDDGRVARYLSALRRELGFWAEKLARAGASVSSVYMGGGTPLVLQQGALGALIHVINDLFDVHKDAEFCVEGSPLTITAPDGEEKLRFLQQQGVTRLSFGAQSFDNTVLKYAARGYRSDTVFKACAIASRIFDNYNLDLIQGLYRGSPAETWRNLMAVAQILPPHLTWYHGRFADRPQGHWYHADDKRPGFETELDTLLGRALIWQETRALGYRQTDGNRFVRDGRFTDPFKQIRTSRSSPLLGVGAASYSHVGASHYAQERRGYVFRNETRIPAYVDKVLAGDLPIVSARVVDGEEWLAASYATGLRTGRKEDDDLRSIRAASPALAGYYDALVEQLTGVGVLNTSTDADGDPVTQLTELGRLFEDETLALFFSPTVRRALSRRRAHRLAQVD